jgi:hypothetical protein
MTSNFMYALLLLPPFILPTIFGTSYSAWRDGPERMGAPAVAVLINAGLTYYNGNYYSQRVVANEARCRTLEIEEIKKNRHTVDSIASVNKQDDDNTGLYHVLSQREVVNKND